MPEFRPTTLALVDDAYDHSRASNGYSRYGAYLDQHSRLFTDDEYPLDAAEFAVAAWCVATSPIMSPGYVRTRPDLLGVKVYVSDDGELFMNVMMPLRQRALVQRPACLADWTTDRYAWNADAWPRLTEPEISTRSALLVTASLVIPVPDALLEEPTAKGPGPVLEIEAKETVATLVTLLNKHAHIVNELTGNVR